MWGVGGTSPYLKLLGYPASPMACRLLSIATARQASFYSSIALTGPSSCTMDQPDTQAGSYTHWLPPLTGRFQHLHLIMMETEVHRHQGLTVLGWKSGWLVPPQRSNHSLLKGTMGESGERATSHTCRADGKYLRGGDPEQEKIAGAEGSPSWGPAESRQGLSPALLSQTQRGEWNSSPKTDTSWLLEDAKGVFINNFH